MSELTHITLREALKKIANNHNPSLPYQNRGNIWRQSLELSLKHPFVGLGIDYYDSSKTVNQGTTEITMAHNIFFQIVLTGGIGLLLIFLFILWKIFSVLKNQTKDINWLILTTMICTVFIFSLFGDLFFGMPWVWIIAGLVIAQKENTKNISA
jgi:O-antigen ligase